MKYKRLGQSGLKVSEICLGTNNFGIIPGSMTPAQVDEEGSVRIIRKAIDLGINVFDTANVYTSGRSEEIIGQAVKGYRDSLVIATKVGSRLGQGPNQEGLSRKHIMWQVDESLKRLKTDYIDIYYLHQFDSETPLEETLRTMNDLVRDGKVRYVACSNFTTLQTSQALSICERLGLEEFVAVQPPYNLLRRDVENGLLPFCQQEGLGVLSYTPLSGGFLTGKYQKDTPPPQGSRGDLSPRYWKGTATSRNFQLVEEIQTVANQSGIPMWQLAIAWILRNPAITAPIVGASKPEQVEENCQITELKIPNDVLQQLDTVTSQAFIGREAGYL